MTSNSNSGQIKFGHITNNVNLVPEKEFDFIIIYCSDVTAEQLIRKFPDQNPNPVLRFDKDFTLEYFNEAASFIIKEWRISLGDKIDNWIISKIEKSNGSGLKNIEHYVGQKTFSSDIVFTPQFEFYLMYSTDIFTTLDLSSVRCVE